MRIPLGWKQIVVSGLALLLIPFAANASSTAVESVLYQFTDCEFPSPIIQASDGNFYGTCDGGAAGHQHGWVFRITPRGIETTVYSFTGASDGGVPMASLIEGNDGYLYGTNTTGGAAGNGVIFRLGLKPAQVIRQGPPLGPPSFFNTPFSVLHSFATADGTNAGSLIQNNEGDFYGTAANGGANGDGTVFEYSHTGVFSVVHAFTGLYGEGEQPISHLLQASDGMIYGVTQSIGNSPGTVFRIFDGIGRISPGFGGQPNPLVKKLVTFASFPAPNLQVQQADDALFFPSFGMTEGRDGALYGLTTQGSVANNPGYGYGSLYKVTLGAVPTLQPLFYDGFNGSGNADGNGGNPTSGLTLGGDGNLYGTTSAYGPATNINNGPAEFLNGTVFQFSLAGGGLDTLFTFQTEGSGLAVGAPIEGYDDALYGSAEYQIYKIVLSPAIPAPISISASPSVVKAGQSVTLKWTVTNATSETAQNCYAHGAWAGSQPLTGSQQTSPANPGTYIYALTCGGIESSLVTVSVTQ